MANVYARTLSFHVIRSVKEAPFVVRSAFAAMSVVRAGLAFHDGQPTRPWLDSIVESGAIPRMPSNSNASIRSYRPGRNLLLVTFRGEGKQMAEMKGEASQSALENALSDLIRRAVRAEIQEMVRLTCQQDRLLTIDEVAQQLSVSKDWIYGNGKKLTFSKN